MPLAVPSNIAVSRLYRQFGAPQFVVTTNGTSDFGPGGFSVFGNVSWTNSESGPHAVILSVDNREILLPRGATSAKEVLLAEYQVPDLSPRTVAIVVRLRQGDETAEAISNVSVNGGSAAAFGTAVLQISGNDILLPDWTGAINDGYGYITNIGTTPPPSLTLSLANANESRDVPPSLSVAPLGGLIQGQTYRARYNVSHDVSVKTESYSVYSTQPRPRPTPPMTQFAFRQGAGVIGGLDYRDTPAWIAYNEQVEFWRQNPTIQVAVNRTIQSYAPWSGSITKELFFLAPAPVVGFAAQGATLRAVRNVRLRRRLEANYRSTWAISSGNPGGFGIEYVPVSFGTATGPDEAYLVGTPLVSGSFTIALTATRADNTAQTATATVNLTVVDSLPRTVVTTNAAIAREGVATSTADVVNIAFQSTPSPATWAASGLPPGVSISQEGTISGRPTRPGVFFASVTAQANDFDVSLPTTIKFTVGLGDGTIVTNAAALRSPWLLSQWELTDIHISARTRVVDSTMMEGQSLRLKTGDAADFAIFFVDTNDSVFAMAPTELRLTIRKADNLDERIVYKSMTPPAAATQEGQTYYLISVTTGNREREMVLEWLEENEKNEPLACVADVDWVKNGKQYSSRSFPVLLELDVTRP